MVRHVTERAELSQFVDLCTTCQELMQDKMPKSKSEIELQPYETYEDEIELMDLLKVLWKWKYLIIAGILAFAVLAAVISANMSKIYEVKMVVAPGLLKIDDNGKRLYIDSIKNIKTMIESGTFNDRILSGLDKDLEKGPIKFKIEAPKDSNALRVLLETTDKTLGLKIMSDLGNLLQDKYKTVVAYYQQEYGMQKDHKNSEVEKLNGAIADEKAQIKANKLKIKDLSRSEKEIEKEIGGIGKNTELLISERNKFLSKQKHDENILSALLYTNTIQESIAYLNTLRITTNGIKSDINDAQLNVERSENSIAGFDSQKKLISEEIADIEFKKNAIENIQILQHPKSSLSPVKPKIKLNILLAAIVGLFLTIFAAFFIEYISKHKADSVSNS